MLLRAHRSNPQATVFIRLLRQLRFLAKTDSTFGRSFISRRLAEWKIRDCCIAWIVAGVNCESVLIITDVRLEQGQCDVLFQPRRINSCRHCPHLFAVETHWTRMLVLRYRPPGQDEPDPSAPDAVGSNFLQCGFAHKVILTIEVDEFRQSQLQWIGIVVGISAKGQ